MAIPRIKELYDPIIGYLHEKGESSLADIRKGMMEYFYVSEEEAYTKKTDDSRYSLFEWRVNQSCNDLLHAGLIIHVKRGWYDISKEGKKAVEEEKKVDRHYLWKTPEFEEYVKPKTKHYKPKQANVEYEEIKEVTVETIIQIKKQDTRFANMMAAGIFMLENGQIRNVPVEVCKNDITLKDYRETTLSHGNDVAFICKADVNGSDKKVAKRKRQSMPVPGGRGSRPRKWENPEPFVNNTLNDAYNMANAYKNCKTIKEAMDKLINKDYKISYAELSRRTGISEDKIRNMCTASNYKPKFLDLCAIFIKLKVKSMVCKAIFSLAGFDVSTAMYEKHFEIIEIGMYFTAPQINKLCDSEGVNKIFPATILE